jgi:hypothetical protein
VSGLLIVLAFAGLVAGFIWFVSRPRVVVRLEGGRTELVRGELPAAVLGELRDVARHAPQARGQVELRGRQSTLTIKFPGLDEGTAQRLRNVLLLQRDRL